jgi:hypothetical protein
MKPANWKDITELVGIAAIIGSLVFVGLQMRQAQQLAQAQLAVSLSGPTQEMRAIFADHPNVWRRGNAGDTLDPDESAVYQQLIRARWSLAFWEAYSWRQLGSTRDVGAHNFAAFLWANPGARQTWLSIIKSEESIAKKLGYWGANELREVVLADLDKLDSLKD